MLSRLLVREGGYVDDPNDPGGCTNMGITLETLRIWRNNPNVTCRDVRQLSTAEARAIYADRYLHGTNIVQIPDLALRELLLDFAVHSGPGRAVRELQRVLGVEDDGDLGPETLAALAAHPDVHAVRLAVWKRRLRFLVSLVTSDPARRLGSLNGWMNRLLGLL